MAEQEKSRQEEAVEEIEETAEQETGETDAENTCEEWAESGEAEVAEAGSEEEDEEIPDGAGEDRSEKKSWAEKRAEKKALKKAEEACQEKIEALEDQVRRQMAEFDNFRKRTEKEKSAMFETGAKSVIEKILPVVDNFERGLASVTEEEKEKPFAEGMNLIYKQLMTELDAIGVKPIEAVGQEFDPAYHNAVMQVESEEFESGVVAQELLKGYTYRDSVVRHSMVAVVQ